MVKKLLGISFDVSVNVKNFIFLVDLIVLDYEIDFKMPIILGLPFLPTGKELVDMKKGEFKFKMNYEVVTYNVCRTIKQPTNMKAVSVINCVDDHGGH